MRKKKIDYHELYRMSEKITPLIGDCGTLCNKACCQPVKNTSLGMYLYPGEEVMFSGLEHWLQWERRNPAEDNFPVSWSGSIYFVSCTEPCPREKRPLNCRFFPLAPHILKDNTVLLIHETLSLPYECPLITKNTPLEETFVKMVGQCWKILLQDRHIRDLVIMDSLDREQNGSFIRVVAVI